MTQVTVRDTETQRVIIDMDSISPPHKDKIEDGAKKIAIDTIE